MDKFIVLLSQRRLWSAFVGILSFVLMVLHVDFKIDIPVLTDILTSIGGALAMLIPGLLALWSYLFPKKK